MAARAGLTAGAMSDSTAALLPNDFVVAAPCSFPNHPPRPGLERPPVSRNRCAATPHRCRQTPCSAIGRDEDAFVRIERAPISGLVVVAEINGSDVGNHYGTVRVREAFASARHHKHRAIHEPPAQLGDPSLPLLLALFLGGEELGASVSRCRRRGVGGRL